MRDEESILTIDKYGNKQWINKSGKLHRIGGPAFEHVNGSKFWFQNGMRHRIGVPAVECVNGDKIWYQNGQFHRIDGPAIEYTNGIKFWYYRGCHFEKKEEFFNALTGEEKEVALYSEDFHNG
jgi:hypothetical protein